MCSGLQIPSLGPRALTGEGVIPGSRSERQREGGSDRGTANTRMVLHMDLACVIPQDCMKRTKMKSVLVLSVREEKGRSTYLHRC